MTDVAPAGTVTVGGGVARELSEDKWIVNPPFGAAMLTVRVPVTVVPPTTEAGETLIDAGTGILNTRLTNPLKFGAPHPEAVSQPTVASDEAPFGSTPFEPETTSKKTEGSPLYE